MVKQVNILENQESSLSQLLSLSLKEKNKENYLLFDCNPASCAVTAGNCSFYYRCLLEEKIRA